MAPLTAGAEVSLVAWAAASPVGEVAGEDWLCLGAGDSVRAGAVPCLVVVMVGMMSLLCRRWYCRQRSAG